MKYWTRFAKRKILGVIEGKPADSNTGRFNLAKYSVLKQDESGADFSCEDEGHSINLVMETSGTYDMHRRFESSYEFAARKVLSNSVTKTPGSARNRDGSDLYRIARYSVLKQDEFCGEDEEKAVDCAMATRGTYDMHQGFDSSYEDLVGSKSRSRQFRIALLVIGVLLFFALVAVAIILFSGLENPNKPDTPKSDRLRLEDLLEGRVVAKRFNGSWTGEHQIIFKDSDYKSVLTYDPADQQTNIVVPPNVQQGAEAAIYELSADKKFLLVGRELSKLFRHSYLALYDIIDLEDGYKSYPLTLHGREAEPHHILLVKWAPVGNGLIFNFERNLYYKPSVFEPEVQLTSDTDQSVLNGHPDWVYEEEVFSSNVAVWFNPSGTKIAYIRFDDSVTRTINIPIYGVPGAPEYQYPLHRLIHYPKAGSPNPFVNLVQVNLLEAVAHGEYERRIPVPNALNTDEHIITAVQWLDNDQLLSVWMNRIQNAAYIQVTNETKRNQLFEIQSKTGWVDLFTPPIKNKDGTKVALILPHSQGSAGDYRHLTVLQTESNVRTSPVPLTSGKYVVQQVLKWDYDTNIIFYTANLPNQSHVLHLYGIRAEKGEKPQCLTCSIKSNGIQQTYFSADFSDTGKFLVLTSMGPSVPRVDIYEWAYENRIIKLKLVTNWESNTEVHNLLMERKAPIVQYHTVKIDDGFTAEVSLLIPPDADLSGETKYPMLVDVYGGPDSYSVVDKWSLEWGHYLSSNRSIIYAKIDGRGSGLRGDKLLHAIYMKLGTFEINDQINVTRSLQQNLPYVDGSRTGIWGWSYGGYAAAMALAKDDKGIFKCATSIAPVTDWAYYDSIYTERYMGLPMKNPSGYANSRLSTLATKFKGKNYLLVHGTLDDNVHYQQSMVLAKYLERNDILFKQISYPDEDHGLVGVRRHLYHSLDRFFGECFNLNEEKHGWRG